MTRYRVVEVEGYNTSKGSIRGPGLSCHVLDSAYCYRVVASYRSETIFRSIGANAKTSRIGHDGAREAAQRKAAELNSREAAQRKAAELNSA